MVSQIAMDQAAVTRHLPLTLHMAVRVHSLLHSAALVDAEQVHPMQGQLALADQQSMPTGSTEVIP